MNLTDRARHMRNLVDVASAHFTEDEVSWGQFHLARREDDLGNQIYTLTVSSQTAPPQPDDVRQIGLAFGAPEGVEWTWFSNARQNTYKAWCRWHERSAVNA
jgi:hypothetical protein